MKSRNIIINLLKVLLITLLLLFIFNVIRKMYIIEKFNNTKDAKIPTNYYLEITYSNYSNIPETIIKIWRKDNKFLKECGDTTLFSDGEYFWVISEDAKVATQSNLNPNITVNAPNATASILQSDSLWGKIKIAFSSRITTEKYNNIDCYKVYCNEHKQVYINKEDFREVRIIDEDSDVSYNYIIDEVTDNHLQLPNLTGFKINVEG